MAEPWERQPEETSKAYAAFLVYRDLSPMERSIRRTAEMMARAYSQIGRWSSKHRWQERCAGWDAYQDEQVRNKLIADRTQFAQRLAASGAMLQLKGLSRVRGIVDRLDRNSELVELKPGQMYTDELSVGDAGRLIEIGARLEALGRGFPSTDADDGSGSTTNVTLVQNPIIQALTVSPGKTAEAVAAMEQLAASLAKE